MSEAAFASLLRDKAVRREHVGLVSRTPYRDT